MKLGTQTGSIVNHLYSRMTIGQPIPEVGMGATILSWTDRHAATIIKVYQVGKYVMIDVQEDTSKVIKGSGHDGSAEYEYSRDENGSVYHFRQEHDGWWQRVWLNPDTGRWNKFKSTGLRIGDRDTYRDPSF